MRDLKKKKMVPRGKIEIWMERGFTVCLGFLEVVPRRDF